jgi:acetoin utilization protein AcuB
MRLRDIMRTRVETISSRESAEVAFQKMRRGRIRHLIVQDGQGIVGVVSDRDVAGLGSFRHVEKVQDVMSRPALTCSPDMTVRQAANLMRGRTIGCLPVVEDGRIAGIVTTTDLLELIGAGAERPVAKIRRWVMKDRGPERKSVAGRGRTVRLPAPR